MSKIKALINISEYEQIFMGYDEMSKEEEIRKADLGVNISDWSPQQRAHWVSERALEWSGLPVVNIYANIFIENPIFSWFTLPTIANEHVLELPFEQEKIAPIAAYDLAEATANIIVNVEKHIGKSYRITGNELITMPDLAKLYSDVLGVQINYKFLEKTEWVQKYFKVLRENNKLHIAAHLENLLELIKSPKYNYQITSDLINLLQHKPKGLKYALQTNPRIMAIKDNLTYQSC